MGRGATSALAIAALVASTTSLAFPGPSDYGQYEVKAGFLYHFLQFAAWPEQPGPGTEKPISIGILGRDDFADAFEPVEGDSVDGRTLVIRRLRGYAPVTSLEQCDLLFISSSLRGEVKRILKSLAGRPVLTVSEVEGFVEAGGMINLLIVESTVRFEINAAAAERVGIEFRSKLLRLAVRVLGSRGDQSSSGQK